jgi:hypothetical protein
MRVRDRDDGIRCKRFSEPLYCLTSYTLPQTSHLTPHTSHLTPHTSHLTPHTSHLTPHTSHLTPHTSLPQSKKRCCTASHLFISGLARDVRCGKVRRLHGMRLLHLRQNGGFRPAPIDCTSSHMLLLLLLLQGEVCTRYLRGAGRGLLDLLRLGNGVRGSAGRERRGGGGCWLT